jgi:hypothetical protein
MKSFLCVLSLILSPLSLAGEPVQPRPEVTPQPSPVPEVVIREGKDKDGNPAREWRVNGKVLAIRVQPKNAPEYYLVDPDGDGVFEYGPEFENDGMVAQWVLLRF